MDANNIPYAERFIDPDEPGLVAGYTFGEGELAQFGRYLNRARTGAVYDLTTRVGTPLVGQGGGILATNDSGTWRCPVPCPTGITSFGYRLVHEMGPAPTATRYVFGNGAAAGMFIRHVVNLEVSLDTLATWSTFGNFTGRGPCVFDVDYHDGNIYHYVNGRLIGLRANVAVAPLGNVYVGNHGTSRDARIYSIARGSDAAIRASYVREFARRVKFSWVPAECGEGPSGGVLTNSTPGGYATCPSGGASLQFVWVNDLSAPGGGYLTLTDSGALSMRRIDLMLSKQPMFGSWLIRYKLRNPIFGGDNPRVGLIGSPGADMTAAGSRSIWVESLNNGGGWWRTQVQRENAGLIGVDADIDVSVMGPGDDCATLLTHGVDGNLRVYAFSRMRNSWAWRAAAVVNDVNFLDYNWISIAPRGSYIKSVHAYQSEMDPHELAAKVL